MAQSDTSARKKRVCFALLAPDAEQVTLAGEFNGWDPEARPMNRDKKGLWSTTMSLAPGEYQYRFVVDGEWQNDPNCEAVVENELGGVNNVCVVT
jgi:1,4-alpha-glucan branching enzyme